MYRHQKKACNRCWGHLETHLTGGEAGARDLPLALAALEWPDRWVRVGHRRQELRVPLAERAPNNQGLVSGPFLQAEGPALHGLHRNGTGLVDPCGEQTPSPLAYPRQVAAGHVVSQLLPACQVQLAKAALEGRIARGLRAAQAVQGGTGQLRPVLESLNADASLLLL